MDRRTLAYDRFDDLLLLRHATVDPSEDDWQAFVEYLRRQLPHTHRIVVYSEGGSLNIARRQQLTQVLDGKSIRIAVLSPSRFVRGAATALGWFIKTIRGFTPTQFQEACAYVGLDEENLPMARTRLEALAKELRQAS